MCISAIAQLHYFYRILHRAKKPSRHATSRYDIIVFSFNLIVYHQYTHQISHLVAIQHFRWLQNCWRSTGGDQSNRFASNTINRIRRQQFSSETVVEIELYPIRSRSDTCTPAESHLQMKLLEKEQILSLSLPVACCMICCKGDPPDRRSYYQSAHGCSDLLQLHWNRIIIAQFWTIGNIPVWRSHHCVHTLQQYNITRVGADNGMMGFQQDISCNLFSHWQCMIHD